MNSRALFQRAGKHQRGVTIVVTLILMMVMLLGGIALARLTEVGTLAAGNSAYHEAAVQASEVGTNTAFAAIKALASDRVIVHGFLPTLDEMLELYVRFHQEAEVHPELEDEGRAAFRKLEAGDREMRVFWEEVVSVTKRSLAAIYDRLHVAFDMQFHAHAHDPAVAVLHALELFDLAAYAQRRQRRRSFCLHVRLGSVGALRADPDPQGKRRQDPVEPRA